MWFDTEQLQLVIWLVNLFFNSAAVLMVSFSNGSVAFLVAIYVSKKYSV